MIQDIHPADSESGDADDAIFEQLLHSAMRARPEPLLRSDLAGRAMHLARTRQSAQFRQRSERLGRERRWAQITGVAAALLIGVMLVGAAHRLWTHGDITSVAAYISSSDSDSTPASTAKAPDAASTSGASTSSSTGIIASALVGELLLIVMLLASLSRGGPPMPWGAEAVAGLY